MKDKIINDIIKSNLVEKLASRYISYLKEDKDDFIQYIYLLLLEMPEDKIVSLHKRNELVFYITAVARNNALGTNSKFKKIHIDDNLIYTNKIEDYEL